MLDRTGEIKIPQFREIEAEPPVPAKWKNKISAKVGDVGSIWSRGWHTGTDFAVPLGTPVYAVWPGTCLYALDTKGREGMMVKIRTAHPFLGFIDHLYMHLSAINTKTGKLVKPREIIGLSGNSGTFQKNATGSYHLHFQIQKGGGPGREFLAPKFK